METKSIIIIPTYNELDNVGPMAQAIMALESNFDILFIDDSSPDGTAQAIMALQERFPNRIFLETRSGKQGLGTAYIHGFKWALARNYGFV